MPAEQSEEAPGKKYPDGSGDAADDDILASELTIEELKEAFRSQITVRRFCLLNNCCLVTLYSNLGCLILEARGILQS